MKVSAFLDDMEKIAPAGLAEDFDLGKIGLVVEGTKDVRMVCAALDPTLKVVLGAASLGADMLVVHHTPLFTPVTRIVGTTARILKILLEHEINLFVMHTNFDHADGGINDAIADMLELSDRRRMSLGIIGDCHLSLTELIKRLGCGARVYGQVSGFQRVAVVGGSGFQPDLMEEACNLGADLFISSEMKHSTGRLAPLPCIEATHYALESVGMKAISEKMGWTFIDDPPESCLLI
ncbi:MAG: Nif3-like dinuclear metal center hexameric protein [Methanocalculus sp.]|nr:Nif3-like dinuclear metal center hexameric protein [Methanocalculus sp.]